MIKPRPASATSVTASAIVSSHTSPLVIQTPPGSLVMLEPSVDASTKPVLLSNVHVVMNLLMSVIGAGMLSLPFTFVVMPTAQAVTMVVVVGLCMASTAHALLHAHVHVAIHKEAAMFVGAGRNFASYRSVAVCVAGEHFGDAVSVVMAVGIFGGCVGGIRIVRDIVPHVTSLLYASFTSAENHYESRSFTSQATIEAAFLWSIFLLVVFPLCSLKRLSGLKIPNYIGFVFSLLLVAAVIYRSSTWDGALAPSTDHRRALLAEAKSVSETSSIARGSQFARFAQSVSIYSYAFTMHLNLLPLFVQLRGNFDVPLRQSATRMTLCIAAVTSFCMALYIAFGFFAARLYDTSIRGNVLVNMQSDGFMQIPLIAVFLTVLLSFPPLFHPGRVIVEELISKRPAEELPTRSRVLTAAALLLGELLVAIWVPGIEVVFALVGASTTVMICYVFPVVMFTRLCPWREQQLGWLWCLLLWLIVAFVASMGVRTIVFLLRGT